MLTTQLSDKSMGIFKALFDDFFVKGNPLIEKPVTDADVAKAYKEHTAITGYLPWLDIVDDNSILLEDGKSYAAVLEILPVATEARSAGNMKSIRDAVSRFVADTFDEDAKAPWVVQFFSWNDTGDFKKLPERLMAHAIKVHSSRDAELEPFSHHFINNIMGEFTDLMSMRGGLFYDNLSQRAWRGSTRKTFMVFYRRQAEGIKRRKNMTAKDELEAQVARVLSMSNGSGLKAKRLDGEAIYNWLFRWFNPRPKATKGDPEAYLQLHKYPKPEERVLEWDLASDVMTGDVRCDEKTQSWYFDGMPHTVLSIEKLERVPEIGQLSAERYESPDLISGPSAHTVCFVDNLPEGSFVCVTYVIGSQVQIKRHLDKLEKNSKGSTPEAEAARDEVKHARRKLLNNQKIYPYSISLAVRAESDEHMDTVLLETNTLLNRNNLRIIDPEHDQFRMDRYLRILPCAHDVRFQQVTLRQRIIYSDQLASLLPVYGRSTGTGNPGILAFNRGGEAFSCDPLMAGDRIKNAHLFLFGPTGAGKSATLVYLQMLITAIYNPRWVVVEAGNSFGLMSDYLKAQGKSTLDIIFRPGVAPSLAPFKPALELVDSNGMIISEHSIVEDVLAGEAELGDADDGTIDFGDAVKRDVLGEMLIIARLMVTGGEEKEEYRMTRGDVGILKTAVLGAASTCRKANKADVLVSDVIEALRAQKIDKPNSAQRIDEMASAMDLFIDGFAGELFNRPGEELPDVDYIRVEMGTLASGGDANDKLSVAYITIVNQVIARALRTQRDGRPTINLTDEAHVITTNPLLAQYVVVVSKLLGRRMGLWLWQATQNMEDYKGDAKKMLAMFEWWMCLKVDKGELKHIEAARELSEDQRQMMLSTQKQPKAYTEGVIMSDSVQGLFRIVQPSLCLALAGTDKEEKLARTKIMIERGVTEVKATEIIAEQITKARKDYAMSMLAQ